MFWHFHFPPISCTSGQHSFFKRPCWVRRLIHPEKPAIAPPSPLFWPGFPARSRTPGAGWWVRSASGPRCQVALPGQGQTGRPLALTTAQVFFSPHASPRKPPRSQTRAKFEAPSPLTPAKLLPAEQGARVRRQSRVKRLPRASVSRFLFPPWPHMHLRVRRCGGAGDRALKAWEKELHGSRTRVGKAWEARGTGVSAKEVPTAHPTPFLGTLRGGGAWDEICHWLRPPAPPPPAPPQPALTAIGWRRWAPRARPSAPSRSSPPDGLRRSYRAPRREAAPRRWARPSRAAPGRRSRATPAGPALLRPPPAPASPAAPLARRASAALRRPPPPRAAGLRVGPGALLSRQSRGLGSFNSPRQQRRNAALRSFALPAAPWKRRGSPRSSRGSGQPARPGAAAGAALCHRTRLSVPGLPPQPFFTVAERRLQPCRPLAPAPARLSHKHPGSFSLFSQPRLDLLPSFFPSRVARSGSQAPSRWVMQIT